MPLNNSVWGSIVINDETRKQCPLSATRNGLDGRTIRGHVDDYWIEYGSTDADPFISNGWTEHINGDCLGDYMKTNQSGYSNTDGGTRFYYYSSGAPFRGTNADDGGYGMQLFFQSRGYNVEDRYTQLVRGYNGNTSGFTFSQYMQEIDAGRPVLIQVVGHTMIGFGYDDADSTIYIHDTWDYGDHSMKWGTYYYNTGMVQWGVVVLHLAPPASIATTAPAGGENWLAGSSHNVTWTSVNSPGNVSILLSTDGGSTFPDTLAHDIADDGIESVIIPNLPTVSARVRVAFVSDPTNCGDSQGLFTISNGTIQQIILAAGWNLISSCQQPFNSSVSAIMSPLSGNLIIMKNGAGLVYWPAFNINQIVTWDVLGGYQVYVTTSATLEIHGTAVDPPATPIDMHAGWNLVSYLPVSAQGIVQALNSIQSVLLIAKNGQGQVYWPAYNINTIGNMQPGQGYNVYATAAATLTYPPNSLARESSLAYTSPSFCVHFTPGTRLNGSNAVMIWRDLPFPDGDEIAVFTASGQLVSSSVVHDGQAFLTVWGDDSVTGIKDGATEGETLSLRHWSQKDDQESELQAARITDGLAGRAMTGGICYSRDGVLILEGVQGGAAPTASDFHLAQNYPNPFNPNTAIKYQLPQETRMELIVYNLSVAKIQTLASGIMPAGFHEVIWNGQDDADRPVPSGIYWVKMKAGNYEKAVKMSLIK